jgi:phage gp29-like protein
MMLDPLLRSAMTVKRLGALAVPWRIQSANSSADAERRAEFIETMFKNMEGSVNGILYDAMDSLIKGFCVLEKVTEHRNGSIVLTAVKPKDPALFGFEVDDYLNITSLTLHVPGETPRELPIEKFIVFSHNRRYGEPHGESDLRAAHRHWAIKRELVKQWAAHLEKYASPTVVGKFRRGLSLEAQNALLDALEKLQRQAAMVHPDDVEVSLLEKRAEWQSAYAEAIDYHNREMARAVLGQTLTTEDSTRVGSLALGKVHLQVLVMQLAGLRKDLAERVMNESIIRPFIQMNFGEGLYPTFVFEEPELDVFRTGQVA